MYISLTLSIPSWAWLTYSKYCLFSTFKLCQHGAVQDCAELEGSSLSRSLFFSLSLCLWRYDNVIRGEVGASTNFFFSHISFFFCFAVQLLIETPESILCPAQPRRALTAFFWHPNFGRGITTLLSAVQSLKTVAKVWELNNQLSYIDDIWGYVGWELNN